MSARKGTLSFQEEWDMQATNWLDRIPVHWTVKRLKFAAPLRTRREAGTAEKPAYVGLEHIESWTGRRLENAPATPADEEETTQGTVNRFFAGDVLFGKLRPYLAKAWLADREGVCTTELLVLQTGQDIRASFLRYVFLCADFVMLVDASTFGSKMPRADWDFIGSLRIPVPPIDEQRRIADRLDTETARIDALMAEKERMLALLGEKRAAETSRAVTRGIDPAAPLKPSGLAWLGDVPAHWTVIRPKHFAEIGNGSTPSVERSDYWAAEENGFPWLNSSVVNDESVAAPSRFVTETALSECHLPRIEPPAVLVGITGQGRTRGMSSVLSFSATINQHVAFMKPDAGRVHPEFLMLLLRSAYAFLRSESDGAGSTKGAITCEQIGNFALPLPPLPEQLAIATHLAAERARTAELEATLRASLALLRERRGALIVAGVTGHLPGMNPPDPTEPLPP